MSGICQFAIPASRDIERIMDSIADDGSFDAAERFRFSQRDLRQQPSVIDVLKMG
jgi:hypothetical protein